MAQQIIASIYGFIPDSGWEKRIQEQWFNYYKALIEAEQQHPEPDYEYKRTLNLVQKVSTSNTNVEQRVILLDMLDITDEENESEDE